MIHISDAQWMAWRWLEAWTRRFPHICASPHEFMCGANMPSLEALLYIFRAFRLSSRFCFTASVSSQVFYLLETYTHIGYDIYTRNGAAIIKRWQPLHALWSCSRPLGCFRECLEAVLIFRIILTYTIQKLITTYRNPISKVPGPWYSLWTGMPNQMSMFKGFTPGFAHKVHEKYGTPGYSLQLSNTPNNIRPHRSHRPQRDFHFRH